MEQRLREDFPIDWEEDQFVSRREFFKFMTLASGGLAIGTAGLAVWSKTIRDHRDFEPMQITEVEAIKPGTAISFNFPRPHDLCLLVRKPDGDFIAYSRRCTHLSCPVTYQAEKARLYCPCHNGAFSVENGEVLQGPPPRPLPQITLKIEEGRIWATGIAKAEA